MKLVYIIFLLALKIHFVPVINLDINIIFLGK